MYDKKEHKRSLRSLVRRRNHCTEGLLQSPRKWLTSYVQFCIMKTKVVIIITQKGILIMIKYSRQREAIVQYLTGRTDHPSAPHYHFLCRKCGCLQDVPMTALDSLNQLAQAHIDGIVESHALLFKGVCKRCSEDTKQFFSYYIFEKNS